jgi:hypothetical protein
MPRALRGRFEPVDHLVLGHLSILGPLPALGSPHAAKRFIGLGSRRARIIEALGHNFICARTLQRTLPAGFHRAVPFTPRLGVQKIALTAIVDQVDNSN